MRTSGILGEGKEKIDALTTLRFFAAAMIVIGHGHPKFGSFGIATTYPLCQGVSFFFVLSGFVLAYVYPTLTTKEGRIRFIWARFARVWPAHIASTLFLILLLPRALWYVSPEHPILFSLANLFMVHAWIPIRECYLGLNGVSWSISTEFFFYLCFPLLIYRWKETWAVKLIIVSGICVGIIMAANLIPLKGGSDFLGPGVHALVYTHPIARLFEFIIGILTFSLHRIVKNSSNELSGLGASILEIMGVILTLTWLWITTILMNNSTVHGAFGVAGIEWLGASGGAFFFSALILVFSLQKGVLSRLFMMPMFIFLGEISFSLYLVHTIVLKYYDYRFEYFTSMPNWAAAVLFWGVSLLLASCFYIGIEKPCRWFLTSSVQNAFGERKGVFRNISFDMVRNGRILIKSLNLQNSILWSIVMIALLLVAGRYPFPATSIVQASQGAVESTTGGILKIPATFSNGIELLQVSNRIEDANAVFEFVWHTTDKIDSLYKVGCHGLDKKRQIFYQADFPLNYGKSAIPANLTFKSTVSIPMDKMRLTECLGIAMYIDSRALVDVRGSETDWDGKRLIVCIK